MCRQHDVGGLSTDALYGTALQAMYNNRLLFTVRIRNTKANNLQAHRLSEEATAGRVLYAHLYSGQLP